MRAARQLGLVLIAASLALASALMVLPLPSHLSFVVGGLALLAVCGLVMLARGLPQWLGASAVLLFAAAVVAGGIAARSASYGWSQVPLSVRADADTCTLSIRGDLSSDLYSRLRQALDAQRQPRALLLHSAGGTALGITQVAELLRERQVDTAVVYDQCDSACAFLWVSMPNRYVVTAPHQPFTVGFHAPHLSLPWLGEFRAVLQDRQQHAYLRDVSALPEDFIGWAYAPLENLWRPDVAQLNRLGVKAQFLSPAALRASFCGGAPELPKLRAAERHDRRHPV